MGTLPAHARRKRPFHMIARRQRRDERFFDPTNPEWRGRDAHLLRHGRGQPFSKVVATFRTREFHEPFLPQSIY